MRIRITRDGRTEIKVENAVGDECLAFTKAIEAALGTIDSRERLAERRDPLAEVVPDQDQAQDFL
jgi:hypothetical protein